MDVQGTLASGFLVVEKMPEGKTSGSFLAEPLHFMPLQTDAIAVPQVQRTRLLQQPCQGMCQNWGHGNQTKRVGHISPKPFCLLDHLHQSFQSRQSVAKRLALLWQGDVSLHGRTDPEKLTHFIECSTKA